MILRQPKLQQNYNEVNTVLVPASQTLYRDRRKGFSTYYENFTSNLEVISFSNLDVIINFLDTCKIELLYYFFVFSSKVSGFQMLFRIEWHASNNFKTWRICFRKNVTSQLEYDVYSSIRTSTYFCYHYSVYFSFHYFFLKGKTFPKQFMRLLENFFVSNQQNNVVLRT